LSTRDHRSHNTVRKVLRSGETAFEYERNVQPRPKLGRWTAELDDLLSGNAANSAREQLTLIRIFEELRGRGYEGGSAWIVSVGLNPLMVGNVELPMMNRFGTSQLCP
jgi:hypothetical protein